MGSPFIFAISSMVSTHLAFDDAAAVDAYARIKARFPQAAPERLLPDVHPTRIPRHVAVIMDGNGRWAQERGFPRIFGHRNGTAAVRTAIQTCAQVGVEVLTLYSFSSENWSPSCSGNSGSVPVAGSIAMRPLSPCL